MNIKAKALLSITICFAIQVSVLAQPEDAKIEALIKQMTLEEKVGQMTNITIGMVLNEKGTEIALDMDKLRNVVIKNKVGSLQNVVSHAYTIT